MEGVVAKRTLKRSYYINHNISIGEENENNDEEVEVKKKKRITSLKERIIFRLAVQGITTIAILLFILLIKIMNIKIVLESDAIKNLKIELDKNYSFSEVKADIVGVLANGYEYVEGLVPDKIKYMFVKLYKNKGKQKVEIYEEASNSKSENKEMNIYDENLGVGSSVVEDKYITAVSSVSVESNIVDEIKSLGIKFVKPATGTVTSNFGAREVIFEDIDSYHTGVDIANKKGTKVVSSIEGKVITASNNKYNGNYVVVENGDIKTIYCHLNKISVKKGTKVKAGTKIGEMGSTGYSTGPHLHFEIVYKGEKINPRLVVDI